MSYRRAWLLLDELNRSFNEPLVKTNIGGANGGGAELTALGIRLIDAFRAVELEANELARKRLPQLLPRGVAVREPKRRVRSLTRRKPA
jgi:molybdate transport system regulatory protein